ncbi:MAG TPA: hypothetical protein ENJ46_01895, partial [Hellea balneolensis]|nr:hypothetical protein [Hellea balneolensis]
MKTRRIIWGIVLAGFVGVAGYGIDRRVKYVNGYCHAEKRYVSDNEVVDAAVGQLLKNLKEEYVGMTPEEQANTVVYTGLEDFYKAQPRCCGLSKNKGKSAKPPKPFPFGE